MVSWYGALACMPQDDKSALLLGKRREKKARRHKSVRYPQFCSATLFPSSHSANCWRAEEGMVEQKRRNGAAEVTMEREWEVEIEMLLDEIPDAASDHQHCLLPCDDAGAVGADMHIRGGFGLDEPPPIQCHGIGRACGCGSGCALLPNLSSDDSSSSSPPGSRSPSGCRSPTADEPGRRSAAAVVEASASVDKIADACLGVDPKVMICLPESPWETSPIDSSSRGNYLNLTAESSVDGGYGASCHSLLPDFLLFNMDKTAQMAQLQQHCSVEAKLGDPWFENSPHGAIDWSLDGILGRNSHYRGNCNLDFASSNNRSHPIADVFLDSERISVESYWDRNASSASNVHNNFPGLHGCKVLPSLTVGPQPARMARNIEAFGYADSLILQGKWVRQTRNQYNCLRKQMERLQFDDELHAQGISVNLPTLPVEYDNLMGIKGYIYYVAKDQQGCRFLQRKLDEGKHQVHMIFNGVVDHAVELMMDPFGNYLMQKLMEVCNEEQLTRILHMLNKDPANLVRISLNIHGTRAVQKLVDSLKNKEQVSLVISALQPDFLHLIKDLNGSHVLIRCLLSFAAESKKFIFDAAAKCCVDIATHQHGCCVLQKCIDHSTGEDQEKLVAEISSNGYELAQDPYGNYAVQYILDLKKPLAITNLACQFEGKYVQLSIQKFSSNVVEKCIRTFGREGQATIVAELLSVPRFEQLLQDPYANYVIQSALRISKGSTRAALEEAIRPHAAALRTNPFSKRIYSRTLYKK